MSVQTGGKQGGNKPRIAGQQRAIRPVDTKAPPAPKPNRRVSLYRFPTNTLQNISGCTRHSAARRGSQTLAETGRGNGSAERDCGERSARASVEVWAAVRQQRGRFRRGCQEGGVFANRRECGVRRAVAGSCSRGPPAFWQARKSASLYLPSYLGVVLSHRLTTHPLVVRCLQLANLHFVQHLRQTPGTEP